MILNELKEEIEKCIALINDEQSGLMSWNIMMKERLEKISCLLANVGIYTIKEK